MDFLVAVAVQIAKIDNQLILCHELGSSPATVADVGRLGLGLAVVEAHDHFSEKVDIHFCLLVLCCL